MDDVVSPSTGDLSGTVTASWLIVWGASVRAASWSAMRAGYRPWAIDLFADLDFPQSAVVHCSALDELPPLPPPANQTSGLLPCGGAENRRELLAQLEQQAQTWGTSAAALEAARNPLQLARELQSAGFPFLAVRTATAQIPANPPDLSWLRKSEWGTGGLDIAPVCTDHSLPNVGQYDQQYQPGLTGSAQFFTDIARTDFENPAYRRTTLLGTALQWSGVPELPARPFAYAGNVYPLAAVDESGEKTRNRQLTALGHLLAERFELRGVWGLDFVWQDQTVFPLEINPRYTAAMELLELSERRSVLSVAASQEQRGARVDEPPAAPRPVLGKRVLYADQALQIPQDWDWNRELQRLGGTGLISHPWEIPVVSDLPVPGTPFFPGQPVCTIWGEGATLRDCLNCLEARWQTLRFRLQLPSAAVGLPGVPFSL